MIYQSAPSERIYFEHVIKREYFDFIPYVLFLRKTKYGDLYKKFELIEECLKRLKDIEKENPSLLKFRNSWKDKDSAERNLQKIIKALIDNTFSEG